MDERTSSGSGCAEPPRGRFFLCPEDGCTQQPREAAEKSEAFLRKKRPESYDPGLDFNPRHRPQLSDDKLYESDSAHDMSLGGKRLSHNTPNG